MKRILAAFLLLLVATLGFADDASFRRVRTPNPKGKLVKAVLTFSDRNKAVEVQPAKGVRVSIPYGTIDKCNYEYTEDLTIAFTESKAHWLEIHYHDQDLPKTFVVMMDKHNYLRILDALKAHTGIDAEILGNADKLHEKGWHIH